MPAKKSGKKWFELENEIDELLQEQTRLRAKVSDLEKRNGELIRENKLSRANELRAIRIKRVNHLVLESIRNTLEAHMQVEMNIVSFGESR